LKKVNLGGPELKSMAVKATPILLVVMSPVKAEASEYSYIVLLVVSSIIELCTVAALSFGRLLILTVYSVDLPQGGYLK
jgi:hypothetical protein